MANEFATGHKKNSSFIITNNLSKTINVFGVKIRANTSYDLMNLVGVSENEIQSSLEKGELFSRLTRGDITVASTNLTFLTSNSTQLSFLTAQGLLPDNASKIYQSQTTWYIDSVNGHDTGDGLTSATAIKTVDELYRRVGTRWKLAGNTTLNLSGSFTSLELDVYDPTLTFTLTLNGTLTALTSATVSASTAQTASTNTPNSITTEITNYASYINKLVVVTSGARSGNRSRISLDQGSGVARLDDIMTSAYAAGQTIQTNDPITIYDVTSITALRIKHEVGIIVNFINASKCILEGSAIATSFVRDSIIGVAGSGFNSYIAAYAAANLVTQNCLHAKIKIAGTITFFSGAITDTIQIISAGSLQGFGTLVVRAATTNQMIVVNPGCIFTATQNVAFIGCTTGVILSTDAIANFSSTLWGSGNTTIVNVRNSYSKMSYTNAALLTATGTNQLLIAQVAKLFSDLPFYDTTHQAGAIANA